MASLDYVNGLYQLSAGSPEELPVIRAQELWRYSPQRLCWLSRRVYVPSLQAGLRAVGSGLVLKARAAAQLEAESRRVAAVLGYQNCPEALPLPAPVGVTFDPYQAVGARFLAEAQRAILADGLGLGKTPQAVAAADLVDARRVLVVAKKSLTYQWKQAIWQFTTGADYVQLLRRKDELAGARWTVTHYETVTARAAELAGAGFDLVIADEAIALKNYLAKRTRAFTTVAHAAPACWLLTGTPIRNRPADLWSLFYILDPARWASLLGNEATEEARLDDGFWSFARYFLRIYDNGFGVEVGAVKPTRLQEFQEELSVRLLRRDKSLLHLQPLSQETVYVPMTVTQAKVYGMAERGFLDQLGPLTDPEQIPEGGAQLTRLRQVAVDPALTNSPGESGKIRWLQDWLEDNGTDHKTLVFSTFAEACSRLKDELARWSPAILTGYLSDKQRQANIERFLTDPTCRVFIISVEAGAEGLNLQPADVVIWLNKPWTPDMVEQGTARAWRRGQEKEVHEISLIHPGTIDESVEAILARKDAIASRTLAMRAVVADMKRRHAERG